MVCKSLSQSAQREDKTPLSQAEPLSILDAFTAFLSTDCALPGEEHCWDHNESGKHQILPPAWVVQLPHPSLLLNLCGEQPVFHYHLEMSHLTGSLLWETHSSPWPPALSHGTRAPHRDWLGGPSPRVPSRRDACATCTTKHWRGTASQGHPYGGSTKT